MMQGSPARGSKHFTMVPREKSLISSSFLGLLATQFLGATNDNILRWLVIGIGKDYASVDVNLLLGLGMGVFVLPYILLSAPAGYLADRYSKREVIVACKVGEAVVMALAVAGILFGHIWFMMLVLGLAGAQAALFGPAKLGSIPEMVDESRISAANGLIGLTTVFSTMAGTFAGSWLADVTGDKGQQHWQLSALVLLGVAIAGWATSLLIARLPAADPSRQFPWKMAQQSWADLKTLAHTPAMLRVAGGITFFWALGALAHLNIDQFVFESGGAKQTQVVPLVAALVVGIGVGSVLAGVWSAGRVELGILPLGAGGLVVVCLALFSVEGEFFEPSGDWTLSYVTACVLLLLLGCAAGLFDVPLASYMQHNSPKDKRGSVLAASNLLTFGAMLVAAVLFTAMRAPVYEGSLEHVTRQLDDPADVAFAERTWRELHDDLAADRPLDLDALTEVQEDPARAAIIREVHQEIVGRPLLTARQIFLICGVLTIPVLGYILFIIPQASIRFLAWLLTHTFYRVRVHGKDNLPEEGPALLAPNHVSWLDGLLLVAVSARPVRIIVTNNLLASRWAQGLARIMGAIPLRSGPKGVRSALDAARDALNAGEIVCIFPEGDITRSGQLQTFKPGLLHIVKGADAPIVPVYLDELWGSIFSFAGGKFFWKWPGPGSRRVSIWFGEPLDRPNNVQEVRNAVQRLSAVAVRARKHRTMVLPRTMIRKCRKALFRWKIADSSDQSLTGGQLLMRSFILRRLLLREVLGADEKYVGVLLPPSTGAVVVNAAVTFAGRVACNLNYTASAAVMNKCIAKAGIKHVLTSKRVMDKLGMKLDANVVLLEDFKDKVTKADKVAGVALAYATPAMLVDRILGLHKLDGDDELTVIFTSGSTGQPKGVVLTNHNIGSNVEAIDQVVHLRRDDVILGIVPFFHSLGFTVTLWAVMGLDIRAAYHFSPLEAQQVGKLAKKWDATVILATPTFLRGYIRRCDAEDFTRLEIAVVGAEKMPIPLADAFEEKFGVRPVEGYGTTELSPLVSVNVPPSRSQSGEVDLKEGSVGKPVPGVAAKIVAPETFVELPAETPGMLLVSGPNVMKGYMHDAEKTAEVIRDGWYVTGDIARIDKHGFIEITGRLSRFSKIGGEMVPHINIEEAIQQFVQGANQDELLVVVTSVPDERKGERLIVVHKPMPKTPSEICDHLQDSGLPNLWIPDPASFLLVDEIPVLGSGKLDLKALSDLAKSHFCD
jgi:acyl-[acyl-carrier-protein]-phospholipid O-acyltransferase / long-chain-fatty-acid--[acyl-carrier-protein] ligase